MATMISNDQENPVNTQPARKPGEIASRKPFQDLKPDEPKIESIEHVFETEHEPIFVLVDFDVCSGRHIKDDYRDLMSIAEQTKLSDAPLYYKRCQTPELAESFKEISFDLV